MDAKIEHVALQFYNANVKIRQKITMTWNIQQMYSHE